jgi:hypothetical protein
MALNNSKIKIDAYEYYLLNTHVFKSSNTWLLLELLSFLWVYSRTDDVNCKLSVSPQWHFICFVSTKLDQRYLSNWKDKKSNIVGLVVFGSSS